MTNIFKFGGNIIWWMPKKRKFWQEFNLADFHQIRQIFFPPKFLPLRYVEINDKNLYSFMEKLLHYLIALTLVTICLATLPF